MMYEIVQLMTVDLPTKVRTNGDGLSAVDCSFINGADADEMCARGGKNIKSDWPSPRANVNFSATEWPVGPLSPLLMASKNFLSRAIQRQKSHLQCVGQMTSQAIFIEWSIHRLAIAESSAFRDHSIHSLLIAWPFHWALCRGQIIEAGFSFHIQ